MGLRSVKLARVRKQLSYMGEVERGVFGPVLEFLSECLE